ncbi:Photosystem I reaction center subunit III [Thermoleptolyngbya sichuanensis A183]|uniref:Photosystem I reaction center subunit III n=1 Tax=Thermoleptolyngbya sichuanensis A183 TaxID=2737172 RepID=A0A6M8BGT2_9CYAN|nr:Photosystem I reaction center subunit III [Thermoleptolyngbya sichuanensis]QKD84087.1 Photosystem I reaction center subunit III [Thermoleptolyngbya sichuanensis A183]
MRKLFAQLFALVLAVSLWGGFAAPASAYNLTPCADSPAFQARAAKAVTAQVKARFQSYSSVLCGEDGLPHLIVDGSLSHAGEFLIPSILFLYIAGWIGWVGRAYVISVRGDKEPEMAEIIIDVPRAVKFMTTGLLWPLAAVQEFTTGKLTAPDNEITVSPR